MGRQMTRDGLEHDMGIELKNTVYREGEGIPVVLVHGFPVDHRMWDQCAAALARICDEHGMTRFPTSEPNTSCAARRCGSARPARSEIGRAHV